MKQILFVSEMRRYGSEARKAGKTVGLVPTMGKLHEGHLSLMRKANAECDLAVTSIFVNPTQFSPDEDYGSYPRDPEGDSALAEEVSVDALFCPGVDEIYSPNACTKLHLPGLEDKLCGRFRPIHFSGVATVVLKFLNIVRPDKAYFGEKDYQQLLVIKRLAKDLNVETEIVGCPIVREPDGVAMSSRNVYLNAEERESARSLYQSLSLAQSLAESGERRASVLKEKIKEIICGRPHTKIQYISICHPETLEEMEEVQSIALVALAVWVGKARLIDNCILKC